MGITCPWHHIIRIEEHHITQHNKILKKVFQQCKKIGPIKLKKKKKKKKKKKNTQENQKKHKIGEP
jgi:hypothetical protein